MKQTYRLQVNGRDYAVETEPRKILADVLREDCGLTGTHIGCEHGVCGACTILLDGKPVRSCLVFGIQAQDADIRTVEGLAQGDTLHPLQQAFMDNHALQCGFCTPGFLMLGAALWESGAKPSEAELQALLSSNLCRCTGYGNIQKAIAAALDARDQGQAPDRESAA